MRKRSTAGAARLPDTRLYSKVTVIKTASRKRGFQRAVVLGRRLVPSQPRLSRSGAWAARVSSSRRCRRAACVGVTAEVLAHSWGGERPPRTTPGSPLLSTPFQKRELIREGLLCTCHPVRSTKPIPTQPGVSTGCRWSNSTDPFSRPRPLAAAAVCSWRQDVLRIDSPQALQGPTHRQLQLSSPPSPWGTSPPTELQLLETPAFDCVCPNLWAPEDAPVLG